VWCVCVVCVCGVCVCVWCVRVCVCVWCVCVVCVCGVYYVWYGGTWEVNSFFLENLLSALGGS